MTNKFKIAEEVENSTFGITRDHCSQGIKNGMFKKRINEHKKIRDKAEADEVISE